MLRAAHALSASERSTVLLHHTVADWVCSGLPESCIVIDGALAPALAVGEYISPPLGLEPPQERLVLSWQAYTPEGSWLEFALRARSAGTDRWTEWLPLGRWGAGILPASGGQRTVAGAILDIDTVIAAGRGRFEEAQYRVLLHRHSMSAPLLSGVAVLAFTPAEPPPLSRAGSPAWGLVLNVPERSQLAEDPAIARDICSPTSLAMVLAYFGRDLPVRAVADAVFDHHARIYGTWPLNTAFASSLGVPMLVDRFERMEQLEAEIIAGRPVVISHRWSRGQLRGAPLPASAGHLVVVTGFTPEGDVMVNEPYADPAAGEPVRRVYRREDIHRTWLKQGSGIVYRVAGAVTPPGS